VYAVALVGHQLLAGAVLLGVQRTTVTTVARVLQDKGFIRSRRGVVDIVNRAGLEASTCECYGVMRANHDRLSDSVPMRVKRA
jgi:hypothetical protein